MSRGSLNRRSRRRSLLAVLALLAALPSVSAAADAALAASPPSWAGSVDVYRPGTYSMQQTWQWCTAADVQIARNIVFGRADHSAAAQQTYFYWMRAHNRYSIPVSDGVDPHGWTAGLDHFVDGRYRLVASPSFDAVMRSAVISLRRTGLPVAMVVDNGNHGWLLTGFTSSADPATTVSFAITGVRVVGPLFGRQSANGYDMPPDTALTYTALRRFLTPFRDFHATMAWDGLFVTMQADPAAAAATRARASAQPLADSPAARPATPMPSRPIASTAGRPVAGSALSQPVPVDRANPPESTQPTPDFPIPPALVLASGCGLCFLAGVMIVAMRILAVGRAPRRPA